MGIRGLYKLIASKAPKGILKRKLTDYRGKCFAVDMMLFLHAILTSGQEHVDGVRTFLQKLANVGIIPLIVFDGKSGREKDHAHKQRRKRAQAMLSQIESLRKRVKYLKNTKTQDMIVFEKVSTEITESSLKINKLEKQVLRVNATHINDTKALLRAMGVKYIQAQGEADFVCAALYHQGIVQGCISNDSDFLVAGVECLITRLKTGGSMFNLDIIEYRLSVILKKLGLSREQFIDMAILMGCDYNDNIKLIGPETAYAYIKEHGTIEKVLDWKCDLEQLHERPTQKQFPYNASRRQFYSWKNLKLSLLQGTWNKTLKPNKKAMVELLETCSGFSFNAAQSSSSYWMRTRKSIIKD